MERLERDYRLHQSSLDATSRLAVETVLLDSANLRAAAMAFQPYASFTLDFKRNGVPHERWQALADAFTLIAKPNPKNQTVPLLAVGLLESAESRAPASL